MSNHQTIRTLISTFSGQENIISFPKVYLDLTEDMNTAAILNQIVFWSDKTKRKDGFFYKTYNDWEEELSLSEYQVRRSIKKLKEMNLVETKLKRANGSPTLHYKLHFKELSDSILKFIKKRNQSNLRNETKVTEETLTDDYTDDYTDEHNNDSTESNSAIPYKEIIEYLNEKTGKNISFKTQGNRNLIKARWNEGYKLEDFKKVIDNKTNDWLGTNVVFSNGKLAENYLHPSTLFRPSNFDKYLNQSTTDVGGKSYGGIEF